MGWFVWGVLTGLIGALIVSAVVGYILFRRIQRLQVRAKRAERLAELGTLTGGLAHEIKNPLSTIQLNLQLLQEDLDPKEPEYRRLINRLATVKNETGRLRDILDDFLRYAGRIEIERKPTELNALLERLREALERQQRFTADAAHELRSPLTALQVQLDMLARARTPEETRDALGALRAGMKRASRLVEQMLTMARLEPEAPLAQPSSVALDALAAQVAGELESLAEARRIELRLERLESAAVEGDAAALHALVRNLLDNAIRYTPAGGVVRLAAFSDGEHALLQVEDSGPGIPPEERTRVFDRFYRLPGSSAEGSGLGLAIAKQVADAHGGEIALADAAGGRGLRVSVRFRRG